MLRQAPQRQNHLFYVSYSDPRKRCDKSSLRVLHRLPRPITGVYLG